MGGLVAESYRRTIVSMDTFVSILVIRPEAEDACAEAVERAFEWFRHVERRCSRFDRQSEVMGLLATVRRPVKVSRLLYEAVQFALKVAEASGGAFDPTIGQQLESRGFNRNYQTGEKITTGLRTDAAVSYRDVQLDPTESTITLLRPLILDLGAVVKGMAIDLAATELRPFENFSIDAGGDLFLAGPGPDGPLWNVGLRHPRNLDCVLDTIHLADRAVCTSGDYERRGDPGDSDHHIVDPRIMRSPPMIASVTVVAPTAMVADALGTAAFVLGPDQGIRFLEREGVDGLVVSSTLDRSETKGFSRYRQ